MNKYLILAALTPLLIAGSIVTVDATHNSIDGNVASGGSGLNDAKVTAERSGTYKYDRTDSSGNYDVLTTDTNLYTVDSMKGGYTRDSDQVSGGNTAPNQFLSTRSDITVNFKIAYDDDTSVTVTEARNELVRAEPWFDEEHSIVFNEFSSSASWTSDQETSSDPCVVKGEAESDTSWDTGTYSGSDILAAFSDGKMGANDAKACGDVPNSGATHPSIFVDIRTGDSSDIRDRRVAHELTHNYGFSHLSCTGVVPSLMAVTCGSDYIINWTPSHDNTLENRRTWY